jgi:hypothetical protein
MGAGSGRMRETIRDSPTMVNTFVRRGAASDENVYLQLRGPGRDACSRLSSKACTQSAAQGMHARRRYDRIFQCGP